MVLPSLSIPLRIVTFYKFPIACGICPYVRWSLWSSSTGTETKLMTVMDAWRSASIESLEDSVYNLNVYGLQYRSRRTFCWPQPTQHATTLWRLCIWKTWWPHYIIVCARFNSWTCYSKSLWGRTLIGDILILKILQALLGISTCWIGGIMHHKWSKSNAHSGERYAIKK